MIHDSYFDESKMNGMFAPQPYDVRHMKRKRSISITSRLRAASDLEDRGVLDRHEKGMLKVHS